MFVPVDITSGQVSGIDDLGPAASSVINWEVDEAGVNRPRLPLVTHALSGISTSPVIGMVRWSTYLIVVTEDRYIWSINDLVPGVAEARSTATTTTQVEGAAERVTFALGDTYVYIAGGGRIQYWGPSIATAARLTSSPRCTHIASMSNYLIANDLDNLSRITWSDIGEGAWGTWPAANYTTVDARPDPVVGVFENVNELFVTGSETLQVYAPSADPALPFEVVTVTNTGIGAPYAAARLDERFCFLDDKRRIVIGDGRATESIGDAIQKDIRELSTISDCWMYREERGQHSYVTVRFPTEKRTFVYDLKNPKWFERKTYTAPFQGDFAVGAYAYWPKYNYHMFGSTTSGLTRFASSGQELSSPLVCERTTGWQDFGTQNRKRSGRVRVTMRRGTADENATPGALELRLQHDDGPWTPWQSISVGTPSQYEQVNDLFMGGIFKRRRYGLRFSTTENHSLVSVQDDITDLGMP